VLEKNYLQQRDKVSTCMVKIGQESLTWKAEIMKLLQLTANKELSSKANDRFEKRNRVQIQIRLITHLASLSVTLKSQLTKNYNKKRRKGWREAGNYFEANLIHPGGPGYLKAAKKLS
jgi:hypothetical protein